MTLTVAATLTALLLTATGLYASVCWLTPFTRCRRCDGTGYRTTGIRRGGRACRPCKGTGMRLRTGRALTNYARDVHHGATTTNHPGTPPTPTASTQTTTKRTPRVPAPRQPTDEHDTF